MTKQFTKEDYQKALAIMKADTEYDDGEFIFRIDHQNTSSILSALQLAIAAQPRPIDELGEKIQSMYRIVLSDGHTHFYDLSFLPKPQNFEKEWADIVQENQRSGLYDMTQERKG